MDILFWLIAELRSLNDLVQALGGHVSPLVALAPAVWWLGRAVFVVARGRDLRATVKALPSDADWWESRGFGRHLRIRRFGPRVAGPEAPDPTQTFAVSPEAFLRAYEDHLVAAAERLAGHADVDDLMSKAAFVVFDRWRQLRGRDDDGKLAFLHVVMRNEATDHHRRRNRFVRYVRQVFDGAEHDSAEREHFRRRRVRLARSEVHAALAFLDPVSREIVERHLDGWSHQQIAEQTALSTSAVGTRLQRAKRVIAAHISPEMRALLRDFSDDEPVDGCSDEGGE